MVKIFLFKATFIIDCEMTSEHDKMREWDRNEGTDQDVRHTKVGVF